MDKASDANAAATLAVNSLAILGLSLHLGLVNAGPFGKVEHPRIIHRLFPGTVSGIEHIRAAAMASLEIQHLPL
jgi:hypothetical protein